MIGDKLTRDLAGKRTDKTGVRDLTFNNWHRKYLSNRCYTTDIDFYEYRIEKNRGFISKAFLEVKKSHVRQKKYLCSANSIAIFELAQKVNVRFFIILYKLIDEKTLECNFWVWEITEKRDFDSYNEKHFNDFFKFYDNKGLMELLENL